MQGQELVKQDDAFIRALPKPLWEILGRQTVPWEFGALDYVAVAGTCGCLLVRRKRRAQEHPCNAEHLYECSVCKQKGGRNGQEAVSLESRQECIAGQSRDFCGLLADASCRHTL